VPGRRSGRIGGSSLAWTRVAAQRRFAEGLIGDGLGANGLGMDGLGADGFNTDGFRATRAEDALGDADQPVGAVSHLLEPLQDLFDAVLQPVGRVALGLRPVRTVVVPVRRARRLRPRGPWRGRRLGRAVVLVVVLVLTVIAGHVVVEVTGQLLRFVGRFLRLVGGLFGLVGLLLGAFGAAASLLGGGASFVGTFDGPGNRLVVAPFVGQLGRFLGQVGGFLRLICGLLGQVGGFLESFGSLTGLLGQMAGLLGQPASLVGLLLGEEFGIAVTLVNGRAGMGRVVGGVVLVLHHVPGDAVWFAGLSHALAGGDLPGFVRSHDRFFPGETARVCSPW
jgi:hypothetical protein